MRSGSSIMAELLWYTLGAGILASAAVLWVSMEPEILPQHKIVLGVLGGVFGALAFISMGRWFHPGPVKAETPTAVSPGNIGQKASSITNNGPVYNAPVINNYTVQNSAPTVKIVGPLPSTSNPDGTFDGYLVIRLESSYVPNSLTVAVNKADVVLSEPRPGIPQTGFQIGSRGIPGVRSVTFGQNADLFWETIQAPVAGEYVIVTRVASLEIKPRIEISVH
jgi:hypothetical protein